MSRKERLGLDFYSIDTDLFLNRKIKRLIKNLGGNGYLIYSFILTGKEENNKSSRQILLNFRRKYSRRGIYYSRKGIYYNQKGRKYTK